MKKLERVVRVPGFMKKLKMVLFFKEGRVAPYAGETYPVSEDQIFVDDYYTEYELFFQGNTLEDLGSAGYNIARVPKELADWMKEMGCNIPDEFIG